MFPHLPSELRDWARQVLSTLVGGGMASPPAALDLIARLVLLRYREPSVFAGLYEQGGPDFSADVALAVTGLDEHGESGGAGGLELIPPQILNLAIEWVHDSPLGPDGDGRAGEVFEALLMEAAIAGKEGQFQTPRYIVEAMVALADPKPHEVVVDPAAGTGGVIIGVARWAARRGATGVQSRARGMEIAPAMVRLGRANLLAHGLDPENLRRLDSLSNDAGDERATADVVITAPPFSGHTDPGAIAEDLRGNNQRRTELLFLRLTVRMLRDGGRATIILPEGALFSRSPLTMRLRKELVTQWGVQAIVSLPKGGFRPYSTVKTSIVLLGGGPRTDRGIWFFRADENALEFDARGLPVAHSHLRYVHEIFDAIYQGRAATAPDAAVRCAWHVSFEEVQSRDYVLSAASYRDDEDEGEPEDSPQNLVDRIRAAESRIAPALDDVEAFVAHLDVGS